MNQTLSMNEEKSLPIDPECIEFCDFVRSSGLETETAALRRQFSFSSPQNLVKMFAPSE